MKNLRAHRGTGLAPNAQQRVPVDNPADTKHRLSSSDFLVWQLIDSAFPTGGFAHSAGLESAWQHGEVRGRAELVSFVETSLQQIGHGSLPFVTAAFDEPEKLADIDALCEAFTTNHVANRSSRAQGRAFMSAVHHVFKCTIGAPPLELRFGHFAPVFGASLRELGLSRDVTGRMFAFNHLRTILAASVRLNIVGPMEAQMLQQRLSIKAEEVIKRCETIPLTEIAQTAPLQDIWQGAQDRLYSRLFQS